MTLDLLGHVPQLTTKNKKRLDHRRSQTTPSPSSQHEIYRKLSLRKLEKVKIKKKKKQRKKLLPWQNKGGVRGTGKVVVFSLLLEAWVAGL